MIFPSRKIRRSSSRPEVVSALCLARRAGGALRTMGKAARRPGSLEAGAIRDHHNPSGLGRSLAQDRSGRRCLSQEVDGRREFPQLFGMQDRNGGVLPHLREALGPQGCARADGGGARAKVVSDGRRAALLEDWAFRPAEMIALGLPPLRWHETVPSWHSSQPEMSHRGAAW